MEHWCRAGSTDVPSVPPRRSPRYRFPAVHDGFDPGSAILPGITEGWPRVLSDLKTVLETGDTLVPA